MKKVFLFVLSLIAVVNSTAISNLTYIDQNHPFTDSLKAVWLFNGNGSEKIANNVLTRVGTVGWSDSGAVGTSAGHFTLATPINITGEFTVTFRCSLPNIADNNIGGDYTQNNGFIAVRNANSIRTRTQAGATSDMLFNDISGAWHTISVISHSSTQLVTAIDGVPVDTVANTMWTGNITLNAIMAGYSLTFRYTGGFGFFSYHTRSLLDSIGLWHGLPNISNPTDTIVILAHGQSNMAGRGNINTATRARLGSYLYNDASRSFNRLFDPYAYTDYTVVASKSPVPAFADSLLKYYASVEKSPVLVVIPGAVGGRGMVEPTNDNWSTATDPVYVQVDSIAQEALYSLGLTVDYVIYAGVESDIINGADTTDVYNGILTYINNIRTDLSSDPKFIFSLPEIVGLDDATANDPVRRQIQRIATDSAFVFLGPDHRIISGRRDAYHFTDAGYDSLGWGFASSVIDILNSAQAIIDSVTPRPQRGRVGSIVKFYVTDLPYPSANHTIRFNSIGFGPPLRWSEGEVWDTIPSMPRGYYRKIYLWDGSDTVAVADTVFRVLVPETGTTW